MTEQEVVYVRLREAMDILKPALNALREKYRVDIEARDDEGHITMVVQIADFTKEKGDESSEPFSTW